MRTLLLRLLVLLGDALVLLVLLAAAYALFWPRAWAWGQAPAPAPAPAVGAVARADIAATTVVEYCGTWYGIALDFRGGTYSCPHPHDEHAAWTGRITSWDAATSTLVFEEALVVCKPDDLPRAGELSLVRMRFYRGPRGEMLAEAEGGSWAKGEVEFR